MERNKFLTHIGPKKMELFKSRFIVMDNGKISSGFKEDPECKIPAIHIANMPFVLFSEYRRVTGFYPVMYTYNKDGSLGRRDMKTIQRAINFTENYGYNRHYFPSMVLGDRIQITAQHLALAIKDANILYNKKLSIVRALTWCVNLTNDNWLDEAQIVLNSVGPLVIANVLRTPTFSNIHTKEDAIIYSRVFLALLRIFEYHIAECHHAGYRYAMTEKYNIFLEKCSDKIPEDLKIAIITSWDNIDKSLWG